MEQNVVQEPEVLLSANIYLNGNLRFKERIFFLQRGICMELEHSTRDVPRSGKTLSGVIHDGFKWRGHSPRKLQGGLRSLSPPGDHHLPFN